jgi:hypothetical protein
LNTLFVDRLARRASAISRRALLPGVALLFAGQALPVTAKKGKNKNKKKCRKPSVRCGKSCCVNGECQFKVKGKRWILQADCTITQTIEIPKGITIDGNGKTIAMSGPNSGYTLAGLLVVGGRANVVNLTIDGSGLSEQCAFDGSDPGAISFGQASGRIENVSIANVYCIGAIMASVYETTRVHTISVARSRVTADPPPGQIGMGINFSGVGGKHLVATITDSEFIDAAILLSDNIEGTVEGCDVAKGYIDARRGAHVTVSNNTITDCLTGVFAEEPGSVLHVTGNTIIGPDDDQNVVIAGIDFRPGTSGSASGNAISNYFVDGPGPSVGCGISVATGATPTIGTNTFPSPGNEQNVCGG